MEELADFFRFESRFGPRVVLRDLLELGRLHQRRQHAERVLDFARRRGLRFTFFLRARDLPQKRWLIERLRGEGHEIASHGYDHLLMERLPAARIREQLRLASSAFRREGIRPAGFRPPFFSESPELYAALREAGHTYISTRFIGRPYPFPASGRGLRSDLLVYPSDWHGLAVERLQPAEVVRRWSGAEGTLCLHPWIFGGHLDKLAQILGGRNDLRIARENRAGLSVSFDVY